MARIFDIRRWSLGLKLSLTICGVVLLVALLISVFVLRHEEQALDTELRLRGQELAENLARLSVDLLLQDDEWGLYRLVRDLVNAQLTPGGTTKILAYAAILKDDGTTLAHSEPRRAPLGEAWPDTKLLQMLRTASATLAQAKQGLNGEQIYEYTAPVIVDRVKIGAAVVGITREPLLASMNRLKREVLLIALGLALLGALLGVILDQRITRPLNQLSASVKAITYGKLDDWTPVQTTEMDEIGQLAEAFNQMVVTLREKLAELYSTRQHLESLLEQANDFIYSLDTEGRFTYVNQKFAEWGYSKEELVGQAFTAILSAQHKGRRSRKTLQKGVRQTYELEIVSKSDGPRVGVVSTAPLRDATGAPIGLLGIIRDVTALKQMEQEMIAREKLASIGQLAASIAHEINNPIGIVLGFTQDLLERIDHSPPTRRSIEIIQEGIARCHRILQYLLHFSRPFPPMFVLTPIQEVVERSLELVQTKVEKAGVRIETDLSPNLPPVKVDQQQITQVLINLYLNAIEAMPTGGTLTTRACLAEIPLNGAKRSIELSVSDTGTEIAEKDRPHLFTPFFSRKFGQKGTGLGLFVSKRIIETHCGSITLAVSERSGTTFVVRFPEADGLSAEDSTGAAQARV